MAITVDFVDNELNKKLVENEKVVIYTYYELRVNLNLTETECKSFLEFAKIILDDLNYRVYLSGQKYMYENNIVSVKENQLLVAIKINIK